MWRRRPSDRGDQQDGDGDGGAVAVYEFTAAIAPASLPRDDRIAVKIPAKILVERGNGCIPF